MKISARHPQLKSHRPPRGLVFTTFISWKKIHWTLSDLKPRTVDHRSQLKHATDPLIQCSSRGETLSTFNRLYWIHFSLWPIYSALRLFSEPGILYFYGTSWKNFLRTQLGFKPLLWVSRGERYPDTIVYDLHIPQLLWLFLSCRKSFNIFILN